jgi:hypothetical protein
MKTALAFLIWAMVGFIIARALALPAVYCDESSATTVANRCY